MRSRWLSLAALPPLMLAGCAPHVDAGDLDYVEGDLRTDPASAALTTRSIAHVGFPGRPALVGDFDANGRDDILELVSGVGARAGLSLRVTRVLDTGPSAAASTYIGDPTPTTPVVVADVNGDNRDDVVVTGNGIAGGAGLGVVTYLSTASGGFTRAAQRLGDGVSVASRAPLVGDVNADGRDDLVFVFPGATSVSTRTKLSRGDGTWTAGAEAALSVAPSAFTSLQAGLSDLNADRRADLVAVGFDIDGVGTGLGVRARLGRGDGGWTASDSRHAAVPRDATSRPMTLRDFDGDGTPELALLSSNQLWLLRWQSGTSRFEDQRPVSTGFVAMPTTAPVVVSDVDGDGLLDFTLARTVRTTPTPVSTEQLVIATFRTGGLGGTSTVTVPSQIDASTPPVALDLDGDRRADVTWHTVAPGSPRLAATIRRSDLLERIQDAHRRGQAAEYERLTSSVANATRRMMPRQCIAGIEDIATVARARGIDGLEGPLLTLIDCAATDVPAGSELERAASRALDGLRAALAAPPPAPRGAQLRLDRVGSRGSLLTSAVRSDASRVFLNWFAAHDRRLGRASLGDAINDPEVNLDLCGLDLLRDTRGEILDGEVLRIAACALGASPDTGPLTRLHCRQMQEGTFQEATPDMLSALPRSSSLTRSTDGEVRASLGAGDAQRLDRLLHGACSAGSAADDGVSALPDYSPESCIDGPMGDVLEYAAMSSLIADCYSGLSSTSASPSPTRAPTTESLAVGPLALFAAGAIAEGILQWGAQEGASRLTGFVFSSHDFPSETLGDTTAFFTEEFGLHNYSVTITRRVEGSDGSQRDVTTKAYFEVNADGEKSIERVVVERPDGSRIDAQRYDDRWGIDRFRVTETRLGREVGASNLSIWRENGPNGELVANCSGSANAACAEVATSLGAKRVTNREEGAHHGVEPGGADLTRESFRQLAPKGVRG
ncbi:MAG: FG-GAP repeat domain-containing protein, partial [Deltaproteobacteria bacterium]